MDKRSVLPPTEEALDHLVNHTSEFIKLELKKNLLKATMWAKQLDKEEAQLHAS